MSSSDKPYPPTRPRQQAIPGGGVPKSSESLAVALKSASGRAVDTRLLAKAKGPLAVEMIALAKELGIDVESNRELVEILAVLEEDSEVPLSALAAVAEILNHIYRRQGEQEDTLIPDAAREEVGP